MNNAERKEYLEKCLEAAKKEYKIKRHVWFQWRDGRTPPACSAYAAVLLYELSEKNQDGTLGNFKIIPGGYWLSAVEYYLKADRDWVKAFIAGFDGSLLEFILTEELSEAYSLGEDLAKRYVV